MIIDNSSDAITKHTQASDQLNKSSITRQCKSGTKASKVAIDSSFSSGRSTLYAFFVDLYNGGSVKNITAYLRKVYNTVAVLRIEYYKVNSQLILNQI